MKQTSSKFKIILIVLLAGALPWIISFAAHLFIGDAKHVQEPVHEFFELVGACMALIVAMLLLLRLRHDKSSPHLLWVVAALMAMGLVDCVHSVLPYGLAWSWLRHSSTLIGGLLFAMVWIPQPAVVVRRKHFFILMVAVLAIAWSLLVMWRPELFPVPFLPEGYAFSVIATNALGGLGFLVAGVFFLRRYLHEQTTEDMVFASQTLIFATASLLFGFSHVWAADWWAWHVFRLLAYSIVIVIVYNLLAELYQAITAQMKNAFAEEAREFAESITDTVREPLIVLNQDLRVLTASSSFYKFFKVNPKETIGNLIYDLGNRQWDIPKLRELLDNILPQKATFDNYEVEHEFSTIGRRIMLLNARQIQRASGKDRIILLAIEDITERKRLEGKLTESERKRHEEELSKSEEYIRDILQAVDEGFIVIDLDYRVIAANRAYLNFIDKPLEEVIGKHCYELSHHVDKPCCEDGTTVCPVTLTFKTGEHYSSVHTHYDNTGAPVYVEVKSYPLKDKSGKVVSAIEIINDITERKKLEAQLLHSQKMEAVGTLAGGIAHDFNNILNVIIGFGTMVMDRIGDDPLSKEQMNEVLIAAERAANLTKRLLVFSRKQVVEVKPVNINELILDLQKMLVRIIRESIDFNLDLADSPLMVLADAGQIEQVLMNLASNARDAMPEGGRLTIGTGIQEIDDEYVAAYGYGKSGRYALITVADTGQGMDEETQKKIFEPFFTTKGIGEGTGLGLAISYGIIKQHSGYIKAYSEAGRGTTFKIWFPLIEDTTEEKPKAEALSYPKGGTETILVAEDDASLRKLSRIVLESYGYTVITAEDGEEAITIFMENRERISLALIDMIMPKKNGKEVGETIRKVSPRTNILFVSGYTLDIIRTRELTESGFDFLLKPVVPRDLLKKVREVLDRGV